MKSDIYSVKVECSNGQFQDLKNYAGQVLLIVNVASRCGFTPQYAQLQKWYQTYESQGLTILAFPCNQFAGQEPESIEKIQDFAHGCFAASFPIFAKIHVKGPHQAPIYEYLQKHFNKTTFFKNIPWNFTQYLVDRQGQVCYRFWPIVPAWYIEKKIKMLLSQTG